MAKIREALECIAETYSNCRCGEHCVNQVSRLLALKVVPRRPLDSRPQGAAPVGYLESDNDFVANNLETVVKLLEGLSNG